MFEFNLQPYVEMPKSEKMDYMSNMDNWVCVHATKYEPKRNSDGNLYIETTAMARNYEIPRATVHFTLNQLVTANSGGNWDNASTVILTPYKDLVNKNSNPQEVSVDDTYFIPNPDTGVILPDTAYIVRADAKSDKLFDIGEHSSTYKTGKYTDEEIMQILSVDPIAKQTYEYLFNCIFEEYEIPSLLHLDDALIQQYKEASDKKAFMFEKLEKDRNAILHTVLRNAVVKMSLEKMGKHFVSAHEDDVSGVVAKTAINFGMKGNSGDKGHSNSVEAELESEGFLLKYYFFDDLKSENIDKVYDALTGSSSAGGCLRDEFIDIILSKKPPELNIKKFFKSLNFKEIKDYNPYLDTVLNRFSERYEKESKEIIARLSKNEELKKRLIEYNNSKMFDMARKKLEDKLAVEDAVLQKASGKLWL